MEKRTAEILPAMDEKGISDKKLRKAVKRVHNESVPKMREYEEKPSIARERNSYSKTDNIASSRFEQILLYYCLFFCFADEF